MCCYHHRRATFFALVIVLWPALLSPATATAPELAPVQASAASPTSHVIAITAAGLADSEVTVVSGTEVVWQNNTGETLQIRSGAAGYQLYLPLLVRNYAGSMAAAGAVSAPSAVGAPPASSPAAEWGGTVPPGGAYAHTFDVPGTYAYYVVPHLNWRGKIIVVTVPPDPSTVAPPVDPSVAAEFFDATSFLYTGPNSIQTGVAPGAIKAQTVAVLRGKVTDRDGNPLPAVAITVLDHPELGQTLTRADGMFDLAVNGGGLLTLDYAADGYLPAQRQVDAPWRDYAWAPDVVLIPLDSAATSVALEAGSMQVARGNPVSDDDGTRQATLLVPAGTGAQIVLSGGVTQTVSALHVRATEYTVGDKGPQAMPAELPANVAYTYAFELSADEALAAGASEVVFDRPLPYYVENFLGFPVGTPVPTGYYDRDRGQWVASDSGRVVGITSISSGLADLDTDGDGIADNGSVITPTMVLTITAAERAQLATLYAVGASLWRVPLAHFSPLDCNWPLFPPNDATYPNQPPPAQRSPLDDCLQCGSTIGCDSQTLSEDVDVAGTPFRLHYSSDRVEGRTGERTLSIPLSGASVPASLLSIALEIDVGGRHFTSSHPAAPNLTATFEWDGLDAYGRTVRGQQPVDVGIGYVYQGVYQRTDRFANNGDGLITGNQTRQEVVLWQRWRSALGNLEASGIGLGGWTLSAQHVYAPSDRTVYRGDGERQNATGLWSDVISTTAGTGVSCDYMSSCGDGGPASQARIRPGPIAESPDGSLYLANLHGPPYTVRRIDPRGIITTVAGSGLLCLNPTDPCGDGGPATQARFGHIVDIALGPDGSLYIADHARVRRVDPSGIITTVAGSGQNCPSYSAPCGDGGPATQASAWADKMAVGPDGSLYLATYLRLRRVAPDGIISTVAGGHPYCTSGPCGDGGPASKASFWGDIHGLAVATSGLVYISDGPKIRRIDASGVITTVAAGFGLQEHLAVGRDGSLFVAGERNIWLATTDGRIVTIAGNGQSCPTATLCGEGGPATAAAIGPSIYGMDVAPDGRIYLSEEYTYRIRQVASMLPDFAVGDILVASPDGAEVYHFSSSGRHLRTLNALTGGVLYQFGYDATGRLASIRDADGNTTTVEHDAGGNPTAIVAPFGQRTTLTVDAGGYLASIADPAGNTVHLTSSSGGLLSTLTDPRGNTHRFTYDDVGRLTRDENPAGGAKTLTRIDTTSGYSVTVTTSLGVSTIYGTDRLTTGAYRRTVIDPAGGQTQATYKTDGTRRISYPDGTTFDVTLGPDPRWGMQAPVPTSVNIRSPGGLTTSGTWSRSATLADPANPLSLQSLTDVVVINGRTYTSTYDAATRELTETRPSGSITRLTYDLAGRPTSQQVGDLSAIALGYDSQGRLTSVSQGDRATALAWSVEDLLTAITDPLSDALAFAYDPAGRPITKTLPGSRVTMYAYDRSGNATSLTPPGRSAHAFAYTPSDQLASYAPPSAGPPSGAITYAYNLDQQPTLIAYADGSGLAYGYDAAGRLATVTLGPSQVQTYSYDPTSGNLATAHSPSGDAIAFAYDGPYLTGVTWAGAVSGTVNRTLDANTWTTLDSVNGAHDISYAYDGDGALTQAGSLSIGRHPQTRAVISTTLGTLATTQAYDTYGEIQSLGTAFDSTQLLDDQYSRDAVGHITQKVETIGGSTTTYAYAYDQIGQLTDVTANGAPVAHYAYDLNGNRTGYSTPESTVNAAYDGQDRLTSYGATSFTYAASGALATRTTAAETTTYDYDALGNLRSVSLPDGRQISYVVDGLNRRIGKKVDGTLVLGLLYEGARPVAQLDAGGNVVSRFVYGTRLMVPDYLVRGGATYRIIADHQGSVRLVVDTATGQVVQRIDYDAFGAVTLDTNPGWQPFGFAGGLYDSDTGLVRFGARDYDASVGRWTAKDPLLFRGKDTNLYRYVSNNPVTFVDPTGLAWQDWDLQWLGDISTGFADTITSGFGITYLFGQPSLTEKIRRNMGVKNFIEKCSDWYTAGKALGYLWGMVVMNAGGAARAGVATEEASVDRIAAEYTEQLLKEGFEDPGVVEVVHTLGRGGGVSGYRPSVGLEWWP